MDFPIVRRVQHIVQIPVVVRQVLVRQFHHDTQSLALDRAATILVAKATDRNKDNNCNHQQRRNHYRRNPLVQVIHKNQEKSEIEEKRRSVRVRHQVNGNRHKHHHQCDTANPYNVIVLLKGSDTKKQDTQRAAIEQQ